LISAERRRERILTKQEEILMFKACETHLYRSRLQPILIFSLDTGCRKSEALKLRLKNGLLFRIILDNLADDEKIEIWSEGDKRSTGFG
jgi:integrase